VGNDEITGRGAEEPTGLTSEEEKGRRTAEQMGITTAWGARLESSRAERREEHKHGIAWEAEGNRAARQRSRSAYRRKAERQQRWRRSYESW
jgi:hypothetical protein